MTTRHYFYIFFTILIIGWGTAPASADIYAVTDPDGGILYTNVPQSPLTENAALFLECPEPRATDAAAPEFVTDTGPGKEYSAGEAAYPSAPADELTPEEEESEYSDAADTEKPIEAPDAETGKALAIEEPDDEQYPSVPYEEVDSDGEALNADETDRSGYLPVGGFYYRRGYTPKYRFSGSFSHTRRRRSHPYRHNRHGYGAGKHRGHGYAEHYWDRARRFRRYGHAYKPHAGKHSGHGGSRGYYGGKHSPHPRGHTSGYHRSKRHRGLRHRGFNHKYGTRSGHRVFRGHGRGYRR